MLLSLLRNQTGPVLMRACRIQFSRHFVHSLSYKNGQTGEKLPGSVINGTKKQEDGIQNSKPLQKNVSGFDDAKLQQIIETSNMSAARQVERQRQERIEEEIREKARLGESETNIPAEIGETRDFVASQAEIGSEMRESSTLIDQDSNPKVTKENNPIVKEINPGSVNSGTISLAENAGYDTETAQKSKPFDGKRLQREITEKIHQKQAQLGTWAEEKWTHIQGSLKVVAKALNDATGYSGIEKHKLLVEHVEQEIKGAREAVKTAKTQYERAIQNRSDLQKEINELLTRKHTWSPVDVERFTELYKNDHKNQHEEVTSKQALDEAEQHVENVQIKLTSLILTRYHEEQLWSDKIRQALTWGTWMLMGVNILLFATATFFVEPWKRRKLVNAFQEEVQQKLDEYLTELHGLSQRLAPKHLEPVVDHGAYRISIFGIDSWNTLCKWATSLLAAIQIPGNISFTLDKPDLAVFSGGLVAVGWLFGTLVNHILFRR